MTNNTELIKLLRKAIALLEPDEQTESVRLIDFATGNLSRYKGRTKTNHQRTLDLLQQHGAVSLNDIDYKWVKAFDYLLQQRGYEVSTINKHHRNVNAWINAAIREGLLDESRNPYKKFRPKKGKPRKVFLTADEVARFEALPSEPARDMFLFGCYTGLRYSDLIRLTPDSFSFDGDKVYITLVQQKTSDRLVLPAHKLPDRDKLLPMIERFEPFVLSNNAINKRVKELATEAGIKKNISIHVARHTFGTMLARNGTSVQVIQRLMGHKSISTSEGYIHLVGADIEGLL